METNRMALKKRESGGCPTLAEQVDRRHEEAFIRIQKRQAASVKKAGDILEWQLDDMHKSMNPNNKGKVEQDIIENPAYDTTQPLSEDNMRFLLVEVVVYDPFKYKENTVTAVVKAYLDNNKQYIKELRELEKLQLKAEAGASKKEGAPSTAWSPNDYLVRDSDDEDKVVN